MELNEAMARAESWGDSPKLRPSPEVAKQVAASLLVEVKRKQLDRHAILQEAIDALPVGSIDAANAIRKIM